MHRRRDQGAGGLYRLCNRGYYVRLRYGLYRPQEGRDRQSRAASRVYLDSIGDSLVIGEDDEAFKVHVHTNIPWDALGRVPEIRHAGAGQRSKTCACSTTIWQKGARRARPTILDAIEQELEAGEAARCAACRARKALRLCRRLRGSGSGGRVPRSRRRRHHRGRTDHEPLDRGHSYRPSSRPPPRSSSSFPTTRTSSWPRRRRK